MRTAAALLLLVYGRVTDSNGLAVPGARVMFTSREGVEVAASTTLGGEFTINAAATREYTLRVEKTGYFLFETRGELDGQPLQFAITLNPLREFFQSVDVPASPAAVDPQQTSDTRTLTSLHMLEVPYPASQDLRNSLPLLPQTVQDNQGRLHFQGGATDQTNFTLDGFNVSDPVTGRFDARINIESVREVNSEAARFSVAKGRGSAGAVDVQTAMGDDHWRFGATNFVPSLSTQSGAHLNKWTPRLTLSGPIVKGRAWFSNGFEAFYDVDTVSGLPSDENRARAFAGSNLTRAQVNLRPSNVLTASYLRNYANDERRGLSFLDPAETTIDRRLSLDFTSLRDQHFFTGGAVAEVGFAATRGYLRESPQGTVLFEILPAGRRGNFFVDFSSHTRREQWTAAFHLPRGAHQISVGADLQHSSFARGSDRRDYLIRRDDDSVARRVSFLGSGFIARRNFEAFEYVQDRWSPRPGLMIEAGLRIGWSQLVRDAYLAPRFAAAWMARGTKFSAGWGVFHDALNLAQFSVHEDQTAVATFFTPAGVSERATRFFVDDRVLGVPRYMSSSVAVERGLPFGMTGRASYTRRTGRRGLTFFDYELRNGRRDRYDAAEVTVRQTFRGKFEWLAGYVRSSARASAVVDYSLENPVFAPQLPGPLLWDTPHRLLSWGWAPVPVAGWLKRPLKDVTVAYLLEYRTGFPFSAVDEEGVLAGGPNRFRFPSHFNINVHFEKRFRFMHYLWAWRAGVNNLTNNGNPNVVNNTIGSPYFLTYGRGQARAINVRLRFMGRR